MKFYRIICLVTAAAFLYSFFQHLLNSGAITDLGLQTSVGTEFLARRMSVFPLGVSILLILSSNLPHSQARQNICLSVGILLLAYALVGGYELAIETVTSAILVPIILELVLGSSFLMIFFVDRNKNLE